MKGGGARDRPFGNKVKIETIIVPLERAVCPHPPLTESWCSINTIWP
jgi:hypothetical protein